MNKNASCTKYADIYDLHFNNQYWQETETSNGTFLLYGAYIDVDWATNKDLDTVDTVQVWDGVWSDTDIHIDH